MFYIYIIFDFAMAVIMLLFGIWFYRSKGQASKFLSGYNMKSAEERNRLHYSSERGMEQGGRHGEIRKKL